MPIDKFGRHHLNHYDDDVLVLVEELPILYYETRLVLQLNFDQNGELLFTDGESFHKVYLPTSVITSVSNPWNGIQMFINTSLVDKPLVGKSLNKGDIITFKANRHFRHTITVEFGLKIPLLVE